MNDTSNLVPDGNVNGEEIIAYLDGELDSSARQRLEEQLSGDQQLRQRLKEHQQAWDLLDDLPREHVDESFAKTTVEMVAIRASEAMDDRSRTAAWRRVAAWCAGIAGAIVAAAAGYGIATYSYSAPNRQLVDDLPILEHLDAYQNAGSIEFLKSLERDHLFVEEGDADQ
jgi:anti-sigma-K factor RskA